MNPDFNDLLCEFNAHGVDSLIVGAHALAVHGHVRATKDLDVWVRPSATRRGRAWISSMKSASPSSNQAPSVIRAGGCSTTGAETSTARRLRAEAMARPRHGFVVRHTLLEQEHPRRSFHLRSR